MVTLTTTVDCQMRVVASFDSNGILVAKVFASADYAPGKSTTAEVSDISPQLTEKLATVLGEILESAKPSIGSRINAAIHKSAEVAAAHGEI